MWKIACGENPTGELLKIVQGKEIGLTRLGSIHIPRGNLWLCPLHPFQNNGNIYSVLPSFRPKKSKLAYFRWDFNCSSTEVICRKNEHLRYQVMVLGLETSQQEGILFR